MINFAGPKIIVHTNGRIGSVGSRGGRGKWAEAPPPPPPPSLQVSEMCMLHTLWSKH